MIDEQLLKEWEMDAKEYINGPGHWPQAEHILALISAYRESRAELKTESKYKTQLLEKIQELKEELKAERSGSRTTKYMAEAEALEANLKVTKEIIEKKNQALRFYAGFTNDQNLSAEEALELKLEEDQK